MSAQCWHVLLTWIVVGLLSAAGSAGRAAGDPLSVQGSDPPSGAIDARIPHHRDDGSVLFGWDSINIALSGDASTQGPADFTVSVDRGSVVPAIIDVIASGNIATLMLDRPIPPGAWTTFVHVESGTSVRLGCLPGDVDGDGSSRAVDVLALVDHLNGARPPLPPWSVDIDRSGVEEDADIQVLVDLLKGQEAFAVWYGRALPGAEPGAYASLPTEGAVIELVPSTPGPYAPGASITVEVWIHNQESYDIEPRLIGFSTVDTHSGLTLQGPDNWPSGGNGVPEFAFDFSTLANGALYVSFPDYPYPATVYYGTQPVPGFILELPANGSLRAGQIEGVLLPDTEGAYTLDVMNADETDWNLCARLDFDFQNPMTWTACEGLLTGGTLDLVVVGGEPDCNHNGIPDDEDIASGTSTDCDANDVPDDCQDDSDGDGVIDVCDGCPNDPGKIEPGVCGCGVPDSDFDHDGSPNCVDGCPFDPGKIEPGVCGCGVPDRDSDGDGVEDCIDGCPADAGKTEPGVCGCGVPDSDDDNDASPNCVDECPHDPGKVVPGICGCGTPDGDTDADGVADCHDGCPMDSTKTAPGVCGCGVPDEDSDGDTVPDCADQCPGEDDLLDFDQDGNPDCLSPELIPTLSQWGLVVLATLLLSGGKVRFGRRGTHRT